MRWCVFSATSGSRWSATTAGARVATRFVKDHRDVVDRLVVMDNIPTRIIFDTMDAASAKLQWWFLFQQVPHLPEALITGREEIWLRHFFGQWSYDPWMLTDDEIVYTRAYSQPGAVRGASDDYRAGSVDAAQDEQDADELDAGESAVHRPLTARPVVPAAMMAAPPAMRTWVGVPGSQPSARRAARSRRRGSLRGGNRSRQDVVRVVVQELDVQPGRHRRQARPLAVRGTPDRHSCRPRSGLEWPTVVRVAPRAACRLLSGPGRCD